MCDFTNGFKLCSCENNEKTSDTVPENSDFIEYKWTLFRYIGPSKMDERGRYLSPAHDIGCGMTAQFVLQNINSKNCFDFDYSPIEGDNLTMETEDFGRLEFIYEIDRWVEKHYDPFSNIVEQLKSGKVTEINDIKPI